jgi:hypothetical protein
MFFQNLLFRSHLAEGEKIIFAAHKHWIEIFNISCKNLFLGILLPIVLWFLFPPFFWIGIGWITLSQIFFIYGVVDWYFDAWLITNVSIIDVEWKGIFHQLSSRVEFSDIKEIAWEKKGFVGAIFNYGDMAMGLVSGDHIILKSASNPKQSELIIHQIKEQYLHQQKMTNTDVLQQILVDIVHQYISENGIPPKQ